MFDGFYHIDMIHNNGMICWVAIQLINHASGLPLRFGCRYQGTGECWLSRRCTMDDLWHHDICRVRNVMRLYLESIAT
jgi:hypothetical protein